MKQLYTQFKHQLLNTSLLNWNAYTIAVEFLEQKMDAVIETNFEPGLYYQKMEKVI